MTAWAEFFEDMNGEASMTRLLLFGTWAISSVIMIWLTCDEKMSEGYLTMYLAFPAGTYGFGKYQDGKVATTGIPPASVGGTQ